SPPIVLLAPSGSPNPFYADFGWLPASGANVKGPDANALWTQEGSGPLTVDRPVTLTYDNGEGLVFRRTISVDDKYLFTVKDEVSNQSAAAVTLYPYALISRHGTPKLEGYSISHEGFVGVMGDKCLRQSAPFLFFGLECHEETYKTIEEKKKITFDVTNAWFGITDKYWAVTLLPDPLAKIKAEFSFAQNGTKRFQAFYNLDAVSIAPGM